MKKLLILHSSYRNYFNQFTQTIERKHVEDKYKWNLADIYPSVEAWQADVDMLNTEVEKLAEFKGKLGESSESSSKSIKNR